MAGGVEDHTIDTRTGPLLGRYTGLESDGAQLLRACRDHLSPVAAAGSPEAATG